MRQIKLKSTGEVLEVENNVAHSFIDRGLATLSKGLDKPKKDKMISLKRKKVRKKYVSNSS